MQPPATPPLSSSTFSPLLTSCWASLLLRPRSPQTATGGAGGVVLGIVGAQDLGGDEVELRRMSVSAAARGLGLGKQLVRVVEEHAIRHGFSTVMLSTGMVMDLAIRLYESCGYTRQPPPQPGKNEFGIIFRKHVDEMAELLPPAPKL